MLRVKTSLIISGGIAAYKSPDLIRRIRERGVGDPVMTQAASEFVTPLSVSAPQVQVSQDLSPDFDNAGFNHAVWI